MPAPASCIVTGIIYDANGGPYANTSLVIYMPQQIINQVSVVASQIISTQTDSNGAIAPIALPQTAIVSVTVGAGMPVTGIVPASATGDISALLTGTVFASPVSGATVQANGVNLASQLLLNFQSGNGVSVTNTSGGNLAFASTLLNQVIQGTLIANTAAESPIYDFAIPGGTLGTSSRLRLKLQTRMGLISGGIGAFLCYYGGTLAANLTIVNTTLSTVGLTSCPIEINLFANGTTNAQVLHAQCSLGINQTNAAIPFGSLTSNLINYAGLTQNSTVVKHLQVNVIFLSGADPSNQADTLGGGLEYLG